MRARKLGLPAASTALTLACIEAGFRLLDGPAMTARPLSQLYEYDATLGWRQRPSARARFQGADFDTIVATNRRRLRAKESATYERGSARPRVLLLGDSAAWGWGVADGERFSDLLARELGIEVVNAAQVGYGTDQEVLLYEREGVRYDVDAVLLLFTGSNDLYDNLGVVKKPSFTLEDGRLVARNVPAPDRFRGPGRFLARESRLFAWLSARATLLSLRLRFHREARFDTLADLGIDPERVMAGWPVTLALVRRLGADVRARGIRLGVTVLDGAPFHMERLAACAADLGAPYLDLNPAFQTADPEGRALRLRDGHLNAAGHARAAALLAPLVRALLAGSTPPPWDDDGH